MMYLVLRIIAILSFIGIGWLLVDLIIDTIKDKNEKD